MGPVRQDPERSTSYLCSRAERCRGALAGTPGATGVECLRYESWAISVHSPALAGRASPHRRAGSLASRAIILRALLATSAESRLRSGDGMAPGPVPTASRAAANSPLASNARPRPTYAGENLGARRIVSRKALAASSVRPVGAQEYEAEGVLGEGKGWFRSHRFEALRDGPFPVPPFDTGACDVVADLPVVEVEALRLTELGFRFLTLSQFHLSRLTV